jgi:uncharacterized protein YdcH (DUF465 family)
METESIIQILEELSASRSPARGFLILVKSGHFTKEMQQKLADKLTQAARTTKNFRLQRLFNKWKNIIRNIQEQEQHERTQEEAELVQMEKQLETEV